MKNRMILKISAIGENEGFARSAVAAFAAAMEPTIDELSDLKTAVSEAVTNCVVHAYKGAESEENYITITCEADESARVLHIEVADTGCGIENVEEALQPFSPLRATRNVRAWALPSCRRLPTAAKWKAPRERAQKCA